METTMTKTFAVHYGDGHLGRTKTLPADYRSLAAAEKAAKKLVDQHEIVVIADTDGGEYWLTEQPA